MNGCNWMVVNEWLWTNKRKNGCEWMNVWLQIVCMYGMEWIKWIEWDNITGVTSCASVCAVRVRGLRLHVDPGEGVEHPQEGMSPQLVWPHHQGLLTTGLFCLSIFWLKRTILSEMFFFIIFKVSGTQTLGFLFGSFWFNFHCVFFKKDCVAERVQYVCH